jgi:CHAT domain-containing protein
MTNWNRFRNELAARLPIAQIVRFIHEIERCAALPRLDAIEALQAISESLDATSTPLFKQALDSVQQKLRSAAAGPSTPDLNTGVRRFFQRISDGSATPDEISVHTRMLTLGAFVMQWLEAHPTFRPPSHDVQQEINKLRETLTTIFVRFAQVAPQCAPGTVSTASLQQLESVLAEYQAVIDNTRPENPALLEAFYAAAQSASMLATAYISLSRAESALAYFGRAAEYFDKANDPASAADCRQRGLSTLQRLSADNDAAAAPHLLRILGADTQTTQLDLIDSRVKLAELAFRSNDFLGADTHALAALSMLHKLDYADPVKIGVDAAFETWLTAAMHITPPVDLQQHLIKVAMLFLPIIKVRHARTLELHQDASPIEATLHQLIALTQEIPNQAEHVAADAQHTLEQSLSIETSTVGLFAIESNEFEEALAKGQEIDNALLEIRQQSDARTREESRDDLLAAIDRLKQDASSLKANIFHVKIQLARAYILLGSHRATEMLAAAEQARSILLAGREPSLNLFTEIVERVCYLESLEREVMANVILGDFPNVLKLCEETVRDFEQQRYRIHNPYRQSSMLTSVATFYKLGAFAAFKLQLWDDLIEITELFKARSAIRSRLQPEIPELSESELLAEFRKASDDLLTNRWVNEDAAEAQRARRRGLWDMISIVRGGAANPAALPTLTLSAVQATLAEDEAVISYYWINAQALLIFSLDRHRFTPTLINITPKQRRLCDEFTTFAQTFQSAQLSMDTAVNKLGSFLFPETCREFIEDKKRLILSPHKELHLFPFHALPWNDQYIATRFAVSYTPNLSSLLLSWQDNSAGTTLAIAVDHFADPTVPPLANVELDAYAVAETYQTVGRNTTVIVGQSVTRKAIEQLQALKLLSTYRCIHLGTHGLSVFKSTDNPLESQLLLQDSSLDALDIGSRRLGSEVAVLCACNSGQRAIAARGSVDLPGDDIFGLQSAFFQSGVQSVLGSLWHVETVSSSALIVGFHRWFAQGMDADEALQHAIQDYLRSPPLQQSEIYYWAPYFLSFLGRKTRPNQ